MWSMVGSDDQECPICGKVNDGSICKKHFKESK